MKSLDLEFVFGSVVFPLTLLFFPFHFYSMKQMKYEVFVQEVSKNEQLKFTINVNYKKWLFYYQKILFDFQFLEKKSHLLLVFSPK